jgi:hypothetical protein
MMGWRRGLARIAAVAVAVLPAALAADEDPYLDYVRNAPEFRPVRHDPAGWTGRWNTWLYMPWRYQWTIGTGDAGGQFCRDHGLNGGFTDDGDASVLPWLDKWGLSFYMDHTAGKGFLYLDTNRGVDFRQFMRNPRGVRTGSRGPATVDAALAEKLRQRITRNISAVQASPSRVAYALDDEISWGSFVKPIAWRLNDDDNAYDLWLDGYYGTRAHPPAQYVCPDFLAPQYHRSLKDLDFSPLLDRLTYNDSVWASFLGDLVTSANAVDPSTPCGFVGGQSPNAWGGFDYAKLTKKVQFIEAYLGTAQSIIRSLNPRIPQVTTHFHDDKLGTANDIWQMWWCLAHGQRGMVGWVEGWFDGGRPRAWLDDWKAPCKELGSVQGPKVAGARWLHDGVAVYYSQASVQVSWCLDIEPHGKTWINRNGDDVHGTWHLVRKAWEQILTDAGVQYNWLGYDQLINDGVPAEYKALILPANYALSDIEARRIREFCARGGTVVADFACGLFDQHGKGRTKGALDDLFGVRHDGSETKRNFFAGSLWVETNQDAGFGKGVKGLLKTTSPQLKHGFAIAEPALPVGRANPVGPGRAVYLNLSPQRYLAYREDGATTDAQRLLFMQPVFDAGVAPRVKITVNGQRPANSEVTYLERNGRVYVFVVQNAAVTSSWLGATKTHGLAGGALPLTIEFASPVRDVIDERSGARLGSGARFRADFKLGEAVLLSHAAP